MLLKFFKQLIKVSVLGILIWLFLILVRALSGQHIVFNFQLFLNFVFTFLYTIILYMLNWLVFEVAAKRYGKVNSVKRFVFSFFMSFSLTLVVIFLLRILEEVVVENKTFEVFLDEERFENYIIIIVSTLFVTLSIHYIYYHRKKQEQKIEEQKAKVQEITAELQSLKNQIDPHFLFNSLNVLTSLIDEDSQAARSFTVSLSKIYRYVLDQKNKEFVTLNEELDFAETYINLLKIRYEKGLNYQVRVKGLTNEYQMIPLSLQLLLENCIKHNIMSEKRPLNITIYTMGAYLVIENNIQIKEIIGKREGIGLLNITLRYKLIADREVIVEKDSDFFRVKLPLIKL